MTDPTNPSYPLPYRPSLPIIVCRIDLYAQRGRERRGVWGGASAFSLIFLLLLLVAVVVIVLVAVVVLLLPPVGGGRDAISLVVIDVSTVERKT